MNREPNQLTPMEYYDIRHLLEEYCKLKEAFIKASTEPFYVKDVAASKIEKTRKLVEKMKSRMNQFNMNFCC